MTSRERVIAVIQHRKPDRIPVYAWVRANVDGKIAATYGSVDAFEDKYEFDLAHLFGGPGSYRGEDMEKLRTANNGSIPPPALLDVPLTDPNTMEDYQGVRDGLAHHKTQRGRFVYMQTPGIFECLNGAFGIENHLCYLAMYESELREIYRRQAEWNRAFAMNCLDLGVDMIHVSDDWGSQSGLLFSPEMWWNLMYPAHKVTCDAVKSRNAYLSLHSDGNINAVLDGVVKLGYQVFHPYQESAGMDFNVYKQKYADSFVIMGGLDIQTTIGFSDYARLQSEIERVLTMFRDGGMIFCTSHFVQDHCSIEELRFAFDFIYDFVRKQGSN
ncbi:MAG: uroporphyrinogen decarboxylase family protein [bacterium]